MKIFLGIITSHHPKSTPYRWRARETFLKEWPSADYRFYFGHTKGFEAEDAHDADSVIVDCPDAREWMVLKNQAMFRDALDGGYDYCFRACDDTHINPRNLLSAGLEPYDYAGSFPCKLSILGTFKVPMLHYDYMHGGCGIWLSRRAMTMLVEDKWTGPDLPPEWPDKVDIGFGLKVPMSRIDWDDRWIGETLKGHLPYDDPLRQEVAGAYQRMGINIFDDNLMFLNDSPELYVSVHDPGVVKFQDARWQGVTDQIRRLNS